MSDGLPTVRERDGLAPEEKETIVKVAKDGTMSIFSEQRGVVRRLLAHSALETDVVVLADGSRREDVRDVDETETVTAVRASGPAGLVKIQASPRRSGSLADMVSRQERREVSQ